MTKNRFAPHDHVAPPSPTHLQNFCARMYFNKTHKQYDSIQFLKSNRKTIQTKVAISRLPLTIIVNFQMTQG